MTTVRLQDHHLTDLRASGLSDETIRQAGLYSATNEQAMYLVGYGRSSALAFPYLHTAKDGGEPFTRIKFDTPDAKGKRYAQKKGSGHRLYIPAALDPARLTDPTVTLYVTEGEKKALKAAQENLLCVSVSGVDSWRTRVNGKSRPIADLDLIEWRGRPVYLVYDSDVTSKEPVQWAEYHLAQELSDRGAHVKAIRLPGGTNGQKVGLDDYLCTHSVDTLCTIEPTPIVNPRIKEQSTGKRVPLTISEVSHSYLERLRDPHPRLSLGYPSLEKIHRGLAEGEVLTVLARAAVGKTTFGLNLLEHLVVQENIPTILFSLEMSATEVYERIAALTLQERPTTIYALGAHPSSQVSQRLPEVERQWSALRIVDSSCRLRDIDNALSAVPGVKLALVDYMGLVMPQRAATLYESVSEAARGLKNLARRHRIALIALCQIGRAGGNGGEPVTLSMARDSGAIEEAADYVLGLWRPDLAEGNGTGTPPSDGAPVDLKVRMLKNRSGPAHRTVTLTMNLGTLRISEQTRGERSP